MTTGASTGSAVTPASPPSVKARQQAMWASGDFAVIGTTLQIVGELLCESRRPARGRARARRGRRQRQRDAGRGAPLRARDVDRLRAGAARTRTASRRGGRTRRHLRSRGRGSTALPAGQLRRRPLDVRRHVRARPRAGRQRADAGVQARRPHRPGLLDARRLPRAICSGSWPGTCRRLRACARRCCGGPMLTSRSCSAAQRRSGTRVRHFAFRYRSPEHFVEIFRTFYGPVHKAFAALDARRSGRARSATCSRCCARRDRGRRRPASWCRRSISRRSSRGEEAAD